MAKTKNKPAKAEYVQINRHDIYEAYLSTYAALTKFKEAWELIPFKALERMKEQASTRVIYPDLIDG